MNVEQAMEKMEGSTVPAAEWAERHEKIRQAEWKSHVEMLAAAEEALKRWRECDRVRSPEEIERALELTYRLARVRRWAAAGKAVSGGDVRATGKRARTQG